MHKDQIIYFIGIGGAGMCGIAKLMHDKGYTVAGSDLLSSDVTDKLIQQGIKVNIIGQNMQKAIIFFIKFICIADKY